MNIGKTELKDDDFGFVRLGAVDIGSNAVRFQVSRVYEEKGIITLKRVEYLRFPLRFGEDVFTEKAFITKTKEDKFVKLMKAFKLMFELYEVDDYMACATSAMREAVNGEAVVRRVQEEAGLNVEIISGDKEAEIINSALGSLIDERNYVHVDVGGGSTEVNIFSKKVKIAGHSFRLGSVRALNPKKNEQEWAQIYQWIQERLKNIKGSEVTAIGTGGNINKLYDLSLPKKEGILTVKELERVRNLLAGYTFKERIELFNLNEDRADVIVPAADIYHHAAMAAGVKEIIIPKVGLREGIIQILFNKHKVKYSRW
jgi:exopolyphosphatase/guanosine-5'-triphosphate,3'-diphosphate pyrophosphatase